MRRTLFLASILFVSSGVFAAPLSRYPGVTQAFDFKVLSRLPDGAVEAAVTNLESQAATATAAWLDGCLTDADTSVVARWHAVDVPVYCRVRVLAGTYLGWRRLLGQTLYLLGYDGFVLEDGLVVSGELVQALADAKDDVAVLSALREKARELEKSDDYRVRTEGRRAVWWMDRLDRVQASPDRVRAEAIAFLRRLGAKEPAPVRPRAKPVAAAKGRPLPGGKPLYVSSDNIVNQLDRFDCRKLEEDVRVTAGYGPNGFAVCIVGDGAKVDKIAAAPAARRTVSVFDEKGICRTAFEATFGPVEPAFWPQPKTGYGYAAFDWRFTERAHPALRPLTADALFGGGAGYRPNFRWLAREKGWTAEFRFPWSAFGGNLPKSLTVDGHSFALVWKGGIDRAEVLLEKAKPPAAPEEKTPPSEVWKNASHMAYLQSWIGLRPLASGPTTEPFDRATEETFYATCVKPIEVEKPSAERLEKLRYEFLVQRLEKEAK